MIVEQLKSPYEGENVYRGWRRGGGGREREREREKEKEREAISTLDVMDSV
jgi:hypothetical protein